MNASSSALRDAASGPLAARLPVKYLEEYCVLPLRVDADGAIVTAVGRQLDPTISDELARLFGRDIRMVPFPASEVLAAIMSVRRESDGDRSTSPEIAPADEPVDNLETLANQPPVIKLLNVLILDALRMGASDIHAESLASGVRIRYRVDGVLQDVSTLDEKYRAAVMSRIKIMAGLDIAERRLAQDGRARLKLEDRDVDLRISTLPAIHGESIVLRILDHAGHGRGLSELGMSDAMLAMLEHMVRRTSGMILVTGPTGSGKTTTLYAALAHVNSPGLKIVTVEEPVEYQIPGVVQIPVNPRAGFNFTGALRSILRHDPDVIMVGELRDTDTAELAVQAALTGHLVFSTLHTNDAVGAATRLVDMGVPPYLVAATVEGILAQRLIRLLCAECSEAYVPEAGDVE
nr:type II/IV secretion system protein [Gemmatimonadaceae bacterium]